MNEKEIIQDFSERLIEIQRPVRILESVRWTSEVQSEFFDKGCREMPKVSKDWYQKRPLGFNPVTLSDQFLHLEKDIRKSLGTSHPAGMILTRMCSEYLLVVQMLEARGFPGFGELAKFLYGSTNNKLIPGEPSIAAFGHRVTDALNRIEPCLKLSDPNDIDSIPGDDAVAILQANLKSSMGCHAQHPTVVADDGITADAAAGANQIKLRQQAVFSRRELRVLEVHEGWIHVGTTLNGNAQQVCRFLSKGTPSATTTQEGLAVLMEILALASSPARQRRINNRLLALEMAENGANFLEVFRFYRDQGFADSDSYQFAVRVFRGSVPEGKPFTKDIAYTKGFIKIYNFLRAAINSGNLELIPLIFCGKTVLSDIEDLRELQQKGLLSPPEFIPPHFEDLHGLAAWMCYEGIISSFSSESLQSRYAKWF